MMTWWMTMFASCGSQPPLGLVASPQALAADTGLPDLPPEEEIPEPGAPLRESGDTATAPQEPPTPPTPVPDPTTDPSM